MRKKGLAAHRPSPRSYNVTGEEEVEKKFEKLRIKYRRTNLTVQENQNRKREMTQLEREGGGGGGNREREREREREDVERKRGGVEG